MRVLMKVGWGVSSSVWRGAEDRVQGMGTDPWLRRRQRIGGDISGKGEAEGIEQWEGGSHGHQQ